MKTRPFRNWFHKDDPDDTFEQMLRANRGCEKVRLYTWMRVNGELLSVPDTLEKTFLLREEMQKKADEGSTITLGEFRYEESRDSLYPPPDPDEKIRGAHALGGTPPPETVDDVLVELKRIFSQQYLHFDKVKFWTDENAAYAEYGNVRCWVLKSDQLGCWHDDKNFPYKWASYVTMIHRWNSDYKNVHLISSTSGNEAADEAFLAFVKFQMEERFLDDV